MLIYKRLALLVVMLISSVLLPISRANAIDSTPITKDNVSNLKLVGQLGRGFLNTKPAYSPDGNYLAVGGSLGLWLFDAANPQAEPKLLKAKYGLADVAYSPDGSILAGATYGGIHIWNAKTFEQSSFLEIKDKSIFSLLFSPDGSLLASASTGLADDGIIRVWDVKTLTLKKSLKQPPSLRGGKQMAFSPDSTLLAVSDQTGGVWPTANGAIHLWDAQQGRMLGQFDGYGVVFSPDGTLLATMDSAQKTPKFANALIQNAIIYDVKTRRIVTTLEVKDPKNVYNDNRNTIYPRAFSPDGKYLITVEVGVSSGGLHVYDIQTKEERFGIPNIPIEDIVVSPDGKYIATSGYAGMSIVDIGTGKAQIIDTGHPDYSNHFAGIAYNPTGTQLAAAGYETLEIWDTVKNEERFAVTDQFSYGDKFILGPNHTILAEGYSSTLQLWDSEQNQIIYTFAGHENNTQAFVFRPDKETIVSIGQEHGAFDGPPTGQNWQDHFGLRLWEVETGKQRRKIDLTNTIDQSSTILMYSPDGKSLVTNKQDKILFLDPKTGKQVSTLELPQTPGVLTFAVEAQYSPDGKWLAVNYQYPGNKSKIIFWDVQTGKQGFALSGQSKAVRNMRFNHDGSMFVTPSPDDGNVWIWNVSKHVPAVRLKVEGIHDAQFNADGTLLAVTSFSENNLQFWDVETGKQVFALPEINGTIEFNTDGTVLTVRDNGVIFLYGVK